MQNFHHILILVLVAYSTTFAQVQESVNLAQIKGSVTGKETRTPISGVEVSTDKGAYTLTNGLGEYTIKAAVGDVLTFRSPEFITKRHTIKSNEDVDVQVEGYSEENNGIASRSKMRKREASMHRAYLDSAVVYKKTDIKKSIDFITQSIAQLGKRGNKKELAAPFVALGEVYQYHKQYEF